MPHHLMVAAAAHTWSGQWTGDSGLSSLAFFWLGMLNVSILVVVLWGALRRDQRTRERERDRGDLVRGAVPAGHAAVNRPSATEPCPRTERADGPEPAAARLLVSDAERDEAADLVCHAIAKGRLGMDEGMARVDKVLAARRRATLDAVLADIPHELEPTGAGETTPGLLALRMAACALIAGAAVLQAVAGVWALWPVAVVVLASLAFSPRHGRVRARRASGTTRSNLTP